jgi:protoheme IX farnesyltransferase
METAHQIRERVGLYLELGKARLSGFVVATTLVGFLMASGGEISWTRLLLCVIGTGLTSSGSLAMNQWMEVVRDGRMHRTRRRPLPTDRIRRGEAFTMGMASMAAGLTVLALFANPLTALLALIDILVYLVAYTPLKPRSPLCTLVGAVCGAIPPMMGWAAVTNRLDIGAWILGAILFLWQIPHFLALAWLYREDYERGGFRMLPVVDRNGTLTSWMVIIYSFALIPLGLAGSLLGLAGFVYLAGSTLLGLGLLALGIRLYVTRSAASARAMFFASLIYLPLALGLMVADRGPGARTPMSTSIRTAPEGPIAEFAPAPGALASIPDPVTY